MYGYDLISMTDVSTNKTYYYVYDGIGSVRCVLDEGGNIVNEYDYDGFGVILNERETITNAYKFHGEYMDEDTGLYYLRVRWYDVDTGRFYSMDEFEGVYEEPESLHKYVFAGNDGVNRVDYSGMYYGIASVGVAIGMAGILAGIAENVWAGNVMEGRYARLLKIFYKASKKHNVDFKVLATLAWSESGWNSNAGPDVGIMQINKKAWGKYAVKYPEEVNINNGAILLKIFRKQRDIVMNRKPPKFKFKKHSEENMKIINEDIKIDMETKGWYVTIWFYKGISKKGRENAIEWYKIHKRWPKNTGNKKLMEIWKRFKIILKEM